MLFTHIQANIFQCCLSTGHKTLICHIYLRYSLLLHIFTQELLSGKSISSHKLITECIHLYVIKPTDTTWLKFTLKT